MKISLGNNVTYAALYECARWFKRTLGLLGSHGGAVAAARLAELLAPLYPVDTPHGRLYFFCPGHIPLWQAEHLFTKEPETIAWIEQMPPGSVLWDIGANVGTYAIYAAQRGMHVVAFEPSAANYYVLNRNIHLNKLSTQVSAYCQTGVVAQCVVFRRLRKSIRMHSFFFIASSKP